MPIHTREVNWITVDTRNRNPVGQRLRNLAAGLAASVVVAGVALQVSAQIPLVAPSVVDPNLEVSKVAFRLDQPTSMSFNGPNDILVTETATGKVKRVINNVVQDAPVLDLPVNS